jgi:hypothetical protein
MKHHEMKKQQVDNNLKQISMSIFKMVMTLLILTNKKMNL